MKLPSVRYAGYGHHPTKGNNYYVCITLNKQRPEWNVDIDEFGRIDEQQHNQIINAVIDIRRMNMGG